MKITGIVITQNEERNIRDCLESLKWLDEIIIVDSYSEDNTIPIARHYTDKIFSVDIKNVTEKRKYSLQKAGNDWIFFIDADERVTEELKNEILSLEENGNSEIKGYYINRKNFYLGKWVKHCGMFPDYHIKLFNRQYAVITDRIVHEDIEVEGNRARLNGCILHYSYPDLTVLIDKINYYSTLEAQEHFRKGKKISKAGVFIHSKSAFLRVFISRKGFLDGIYGFYAACTDACVNFLTHLKLLKMQNRI
jgi:glycosyltransferase involved in cell wall biosynthesis